MEKLLEHLGYATPFIYAAAAYGLFAWLDKEASDDAKAALAGTMNLMDYDKKRIASALVEVFDRLYAYPLLRWRAFFRSMLFTLAVSGFFIFETRASPHPNQSSTHSDRHRVSTFYLYKYSFGLLLALPDQSPAIFVLARDQSSLSLREYLLLSLSLTSEASSDRHLPNCYRLLVVLPYPPLLRKALLRMCRFLDSLYISPSRRPDCSSSSGFHCSR
jgi:hypothetical protein